MDGLYYKNKYVTFSKNYLLSQIGNTKRKMIKNISMVIDKQKKKRGNDSKCNDCLNHVKIECENAM